MEGDEGRHASATRARKTKRRRERTIARRGAQQRLRERCFRNQTPRWLRFACTGTVAAAWPGYDEHERLTLVIDVVDRIESDPRRQRREAWQLFRPSL